MNLADRKEGDVLVLLLEGRLDGTTTPEFQEKLLGFIAAGESTIVLDCSQLSFVSSVGLRSLILAAKKLKAGSGTMVLASMADMIKEVFEIAGFLTIFPIHDSVEDAVNGL